MDPFADLAEAILIAARELRIRENDTDSTISLAPSHAQVMSYVDAHPGATPSEAADATGLLRTNLSSAVRELERIGFIEKRPDPNDGRAVRLYSTPIAAENLARLQKRWASVLAGILGEHDDPAQATALLRRLAEGLADERRNLERRWAVHNY
jgi:DNA-binding MarR family transcriptional regulator